MDFTTRSFLFNTWFTCEIENYRYMYTWECSEPWHCALLFMQLDVFKQVWLHSLLRHLWDHVSFKVVLLLLFLHKERKSSIYLGSCHHCWRPVVLGLCFTVIVVKQKGITWCNTWLQFLLSHLIIPPPPPSLKLHTDQQYSMPFR